MSTLYVSDLDGTLLGADSRLSDRTATLLGELIEREGILFTIATARTPATVVPIMERLPQARLPFIVVGGAAWWDPSRCDFSHVNVVPHDVVTAVDEVMSRHGLHPLIYCREGNTLHTFHYGTLSAQEEAFVAQRRGLRFKKFTLDEPDYIARSHDVLLVFSMNRYDRLKAVREDILAAGIDCECTVYHDIFDPTIGYFELFRAGCTKAAAIRRMAATVGAERVVVFGDNRNDVPMMRAATVSVAMGNAFDEVKAVATTVTGPNTEDSVARWIAADIALGGRVG